MKYALCLLLLSASCFANTIGYITAISTPTGFGLDAHAYGTNSYDVTYTVYDFTGDPFQFGPYTVAPSILISFGPPAIQLLQDDVAHVVFGSQTIDLNITVPQIGSTNTVYVVIPDPPPSPAPEPSSLSLLGISLFVLFRFSRSTIFRGSH